MLAAARGLASRSKERVRSSVSGAPSSAAASTAASASSSASQAPSQAARGSTPRSVPAAKSKAAAKPKPKPKPAAAKATPRAASFDEDLLPIPHGLQCVICREVFEDPVFTEDGHSYCRGCIQEWFRAHDTRVAEFYRVPANIAPHSRKVPPNLLAPMTQLQLSSRQLQPNIALKQAVEAFCESRPNDEKRERERRKLQKAMEEAKAVEGALKSNFKKEVKTLQGQVQDLQDELGQVKHELEDKESKLQNRAQAVEGFQDPFFELEFEELDRDMACCAEDLGLMNLPYATELPRSRVGRPRSQSC